MLHTVEALGESRFNRVQVLVEADRLVFLRSHGLDNNRQRLLEISRGDRIGHSHIHLRVPAESAFDGDRFRAAAKILEDVEVEAVDIDGEKVDAVDAVVVAIVVSDFRSGPDAGCTKPSMQITSG